MEKISDSDFEIKFLEKIVQEKPNYIDALIILAESYTKKGKYQEGLKIDKRLAKLCPQDGVIRYNLACSYALAGKKQLALKALAVAFKHGYHDVDHMKKDSDLSSLHSEPEFKALIKRME